VLGDAFWKQMGTAYHCHSGKLWGKPFYLGHAPYDERFVFAQGVAAPAALFFISCYAGP